MVTAVVEDTPEVIAARGSAKASRSLPPPPPGRRHSVPPVPPLPARAPLPSRPPAPSAHEELRALVGGVAEALGLLARTVHELEGRVAVLEAEPEIPVELALPFELAPRAPQVADTSALASPVAPLVRAAEEDKMEVPWSGARRQRNVAMALALLLLVVSCGLLAAMAFSYLTP